MINVRKLYLVGLTLALAGCQQHTVGNQPAANLQVTPTTTTELAAAKRQIDRAAESMKGCFDRGLIEFVQPDVYTAAALAYDSCQREVREWHLAVTQEIDLRLGGSRTSHAMSERLMAEFRTSMIPALAVRLRRYINTAQESIEKRRNIDVPAAKSSEQSI